ncbi:MAG: methylated-DNA--[Oscillospiraceae bacterium]|nr:methylated-DNA--[protein]-cysteine S-methyltransferase [Oscillospiraceae bacterium]
ENWGEVTWGRTETLNRTVLALDAFFAGTPLPEELPLDHQGTPFQQQVWQALRTIPWGETRTYGHIARQIGRPKAARAVGQACNRNPIPLLIPCHRVVGAKGLTGYAGGLERKGQLLEMENVHKLQQK